MQPQFSDKGWGTFELVMSMN